MACTLHRYCMYRNCNVYNYILSLYIGFRGVDNICTQHVHLGEITLQLSKRKQTLLLHELWWGTQEHSRVSHSLTPSHTHSLTEMRATCLLQPRRAPAGAVWDARGCCATLGRRTCSEWQCRWPSAITATWTSPSHPTNTHTHTHTSTHTHSQVHEVRHIKTTCLRPSQLWISPYNLTFYSFQTLLFPSA